MAPFPPEIWRLISNHLRPNEIANLALVSSDIQSLVRPSLYRHVVLKDSKPNFRTTVKLLIREKCLAKQVAEFELISIRYLNHPSSDGQTYVQELLRLFQNLTRLRALSLMRCPSFNGDDRIAFSRVLHSLNSSLTAFRYWNDQDWEFPQVELSCIKVFYWNTQGILSPASFSIMELSLSSLVDIRIFAYVGDYCTADLIRFCDLRFPCLKYFAIGTFFNIIDDYAPDALTGFLVGHPSIVNLALGFDINDEDATEPAEDLLESNMLPSLLGFHGRFTCMTMFARRGCRFIKQLTNLSTGGGSSFDAGNSSDTDSSSDTVIELDDMMEALSNVGGLPSMEWLHFILGNEGRVHTDAIQRWMRNFSELCPNLKYWSGGGLNRAFDDVGTFAGLFLPFLKLERIEIPQECVPSSQERESWLKSLAEQCPSLQSLGFMGDLKYMTCVVNRDANGLVSDVIISENERKLRPKDWLAGLC